MKKIILPLLLIITVAVHAQKRPAFRINVYTGYVFDDKVDSYYSTTDYYNGTIKGNFQWGVGAELMLNQYQGVELSYLRMDTKAPTTYYDNGAVLDPIKTREFDMAINYLMLGTTRYFKPNTKVEPYVGVQAGIGIFNVSNPTNGNEATATKFSWGIKGGANFWVTPKVAVKLNLGLQSAVEAVGGGLYFGPGGVGTGISSYSTLYQFSIGSGLAFAF